MSVNENLYSVISRSKVFVSVHLRSALYTETRAFACVNSISTTSLNNSEHC